LQSCSLFFPSAPRLFEARLSLPTRSMSNGGWLAGRPASRPGGGAAESRKFKRSLAAELEVGASGAPAAEAAGGGGSEIALQQRAGSPLNPRSSTNSALNGGTFNSLVGSAHNQSDRQRRKRASRSLSGFKGSRPSWCCGRQAARAGPAPPSQLLALARLAASLPTSPLGRQLSRLKMSRSASNKRCPFPAYLSPSLPLKFKPSKAEPSNGWLAGE